MADEQGELNVSPRLKGQDGTDAGPADSNAAEAPLEQEQGEAQDCKPGQAPAPASPESRSPKSHRTKRNPVTRRYAVYIAKDMEGVVLYVGQSMRLGNRLSQHKADKDWWESIAAIEVRHVESKADANRVERDLIRALHPLHNLAMNKVDSPVPRCPECGSPDLEVVMYGKLIARPTGFQGDQVLLNRRLLWEPAEDHPGPFVYCENCVDDVTALGVSDGAVVREAEIPDESWFTRAFYRWGLE